MYDTTRGFGFIRPTREDITNGRQIFFHHTSLDEHLPEPAIGMSVSFSCEESPKGYRASRVELA